MKIKTMSDMLEMLEFTDHPCNQETENTEVNIEVGNYGISVYIAIYDDTEPNDPMVYEKNYTLGEDQTELMIDLLNDCCEIDFNPEYVSMTANINVGGSSLSELRKSDCEDIINFWKEWSEKN